MTLQDLRVPFAIIEGTHLAELIDQLTAVIATADDTPDSGVERLIPTPYPDDAEASAEFAAATREDLLDRRTADAAVVRNALAPFIDREDATDPESPTHVDVVIRTDELDAWLRTLTALRLVIASRLNIADDVDLEDIDDPRFGIFHWLGYRLDALIAVADALEDMSDGDAPKEV